MEVEFPVEGKIVNAKIILVCNLCILAVFAKAQYGPGGRYHTPFPNDSDAIAQRSAQMMAAQAIANRQAIQQYQNALEQQAQQLQEWQKKILARIASLQSNIASNQVQTDSEKVFLAALGQSQNDGDKEQIPDAINDLASKQASLDVANKSLQDFLDAIEAAKQKAKADADAKKKALQDRALKFNQDEADKGDPAGLFRMGERYRDGDGVPRDLSKARDYFTKAVTAGSPTAAGALSKLDQTGGIADRGSVDPPNVLTNTQIPLPSTPRQFKTVLVTNLVKPECVRRVNGRLYNTADTEHWVHPAFDNIPAANPLNNPWNVVNYSLSVETVAEDKITCQVQRKEYQHETYTGQLGLADRRPLREIVIYNYPNPLSLTTGQEINPLCLRVGNYIEGGTSIAAYDYGIQYTNLVPWVTETNVEVKVADSTTTQ